MTGTWRNAKTDFPRDGLQVLCLQELGSYRVMCFGSHWMCRPREDGWMTYNGNPNVIAWMTLPEIPEGEIPDRVTVQDMESVLRDCVNELCLQCGKYHEAHEGACDGCRWKETKEALRR